MADVWDVEVDTWSLKSGDYKKSLTGFGRKTRIQIVDEVFYYEDSFCYIQTRDILIDNMLTKVATLRLYRNILEEKGRTVLGAAVLALA